MAQTGDIYLVKLNLNVHGNTASVGFHYQQTAGPVEDVDRTGVLAGGFAGSLGLLEPVLAEDCQIASLDVVQVNDLISGFNDAPSLGLFVYAVGDIVGEALPLTKAMVVKLFQNELPGKHNGRSFWPGIAEPSTDGNIISAQAVLDGIEAFYDDIRIISETVGADTFDFQHVVYHPNKLNPPPDASPVSQIAASPTIFSQRRRRTEARGVNAV